MKHEITSHQDLNSLEFKLLEELPKLRVLNSLINDDESEKQEKFFKDIEDNLDNITRVKYVFEVIHKRDDGFICSTPNSNYHFIKNYPNMKVGEIYFLSNERYRTDNYIIKINKELTDDKKVKEFFSKMDKWVEEGEGSNWERGKRAYNDDLIQAEDIKGGEITFNIITEAFEEHKLERIKEEKERKERRVADEKKQEIKEGEEEAIYNSKGTGIFGGNNEISITDKVIKYIADEDEYILEDKVNKIFSYDNLNRGWGGRRDMILSPIETSLNDKKITYTKKKADGVIYKVVYTGNKCKINEANIPAVKIKFILNKIHYKGATKDEIKVLVKLNGMKADFIGMENLENRAGDFLKVPIISKAIDDKTFEVEFLGKKKTFNWDEIKDWFFWNNSRSIKAHMNNSELLKFSEEMGANKKELFINLKKIKILNALENEDEDNN